MKTLVVGTGVIGTTYGWALTEAGVDVTHYVRPSSPDAGTVREVSLDVLDERRGHRGTRIATYPMRCVAQVDATDGYELVLVAVNAHQLAEVLATLEPVVGPDATFLLMTSNWDGTAAVDALLPRERYLLGYPDCGGTARAGVYWVELGDRVHLGALEGQSAQRLAEVAALFASATMRPDVRSDILHWLWVHNASATGFAAGYAKYGGVKELIADRPLLRTCVQATVEALRLCQTRGVALEQYPEVSFVGWPTWVVMTFVRRMWFTNPSMRRYTSDAASPGSLAETTLHYAAMRRTADELGVPVPALARLAAYVQPAVAAA